ncbi:15015_t:CDS:1 [Acaulospora colombiana]|uniref:15015_t:CDS:1 n=1 Tax=Acaulospora colombiana TaxID=27376 RepID=A0ACA9K5Z3_9GLOM|nr:15015_t:CDS:1 [Acaulospora colombiana]
MAFSSVDELTARLEKLDQNITLTLQEIDNNFSTCQHVVTTKILPQISRFAEVSEDIWENSKLWWSFLESLDLSSSNDSTSPVSMEYINSKKKLFEANSDSKTNKSSVNSVDLSKRRVIPLKLEPQTAESIINSNKRKFVDDNNPLISEDSRTTSTPPTLPPFLNSYNSVTSTPLPNPPQYAHKAMQSLNWENNISRTTASTSISLPTIPPSDNLKPKPTTLIERVMQRQNFINKTPMKPTKEVSETAKGTVTPRPGPAHPGFPSSATGTDSDFDFTDFSPPVTIQFSMAPSKILKTPAKQAAKIIVDDLLSMMSPIPSTPISTNKDNHYFNKSLNTFSSVFNSELGYDIYKKYHISSSPNAEKLDQPAPVGDADRLSKYPPRDNLTTSPVNTLTNNIREIKGSENSITNIENPFNIIKNNKEEVYPSDDNDDDVLVDDTFFDVKAAALRRQQKQRQQPPTGEETRILSCNMRTLSLDDGDESEDDEVMDSPCPSGPVMRTETQIDG